MILLRAMPIVLTQDHDWAKSIRFPIKPGTIIILPGDAVLVEHPEEEKEP